MTHRTTVNLVRWTTVACLALLLAGCSMADHHQTASDEARGRVARARAAMKLQIAQQQFDTGDLEQAEGALAEALVVEPEFAPLHTLAGRISLERGQLEKAEDYFNKAAELAPEQAEPHYYLGVVRQRWQRFDEALSSYSRAYELQNDNPAFLLARCEMLVALGQEKLAQAELERRLNYFESSAGVWQAAGHLRQLNGEHARAVSAYRQAALLDPTDLGLIEELARAQLAADMPADAVDQIAMLIADAEYGKRRDIQLLYVRAAERAGRFDQAREQCMAMTERNPRDVEAWIRLGGINWTLGDTSGALTAANRVMAISPRRPEGYLLAGLVWQKQDKTHRAIANFYRASELAPNDPEPAVLTGLALESIGEHGAATQAYEEALRRHPGHREARALLARVVSAAP